MDFSSTSALYPSRDELRQWEKSFENGCLTFREFLKTEYSTENLDFWLECEEFKKMKNGKKATQQRAHAIYDQYIATQSPREVNLDADTKTVTKQALEEGAKPDMFSLAQNRIEHLMEKDSYPRFLKSDGFLKLFGDSAEIISNEITVNVIPPGAEAVHSFSA
uniref:RGS domain-containing protein n=1 Tax=Syphacia muris TaxID=451379 RepID=A0A0N5AEZ3_9BILA